MQIGIVSIFPQLFEALHFGIVGRAIKQKLINFCVSNPLDFGLGHYQAIDDKPYGGGPGMVMRPEPLMNALTACQQQLKSRPKRIYLSPQGQPLNQTIVTELAQLPSLLLLCGRYEGIDERIIMHEIDVEYSVGDYILSGGEFAACVLIDSITRLLPGALGAATSTHSESFTNGLLEYPQYTRPEVYNNHSVPEVLRSGNHAKIAHWREKQALGRTWQKRPDLLDKLKLTLEQKALLAEFQNES